MSHSPSFFCFLPFFHWNWKKRRRKKLKYVARTVKGWTRMHSRHAPSMVCNAMQHTHTHTHRGWFEFNLNLRETKLWINSTADLGFIFAYHFRYHTPKPFPGIDSNYLETCAHVTLFKNPLITITLFNIIIIIIYIYIILIWITFTRTHTLTW